jgi:hypothetical protein
MIDPTPYEEATEIVTAMYPNELIQFRLLGIADCYNWVVRIFSILAYNVAMHTCTK